VSRIVFEDRYVTLTIDDARGLVRYTRTREPFPTLDAMRTSNQAVAGASAWIGRPTHTLLIDVRDAPPRNDDAFEQEVGRSLEAFVPGYKAYAMLVKTAVGRLQVSRMTRAPGAKGAPVFTSEAEALAHLGVT
jgi:hypothetical protein